MSQENINNIAAAAIVAASANGGAVTPTYTKSRGFTTTGGFGTTAGTAGTHSAAGVYVLVLDQIVDPNNCLLFANALSSTAGDDCIAVFTNSGQTVTCTATRAGAASDVPSFNVLVFQLPNA